MKPTNFSNYITGFLGNYLPMIRNVSPNTITSYCETFRLFLIYCRDVRGKKIERIVLKDISSDFILDFLSWLEKERGTSIATRNQRLSAIHSFFKYVQAESPENLLYCQRILSIPFQKTATPVMNYLTIEEMKLLLASPDTTKLSGRRDLMLLSLLYDTAARVQEICDISVRDVRIEAPPQVLLTGKGRKTRAVPILPGTVELFKLYLDENRLLSTNKLDYPLFFNQSGNKLTRAGISYILSKHSACLGKEKKITPHVLRHSKAMHMLQAEIDITTIRDILGHASVETTKIYAESDIVMKRKALESVTDSPFSLMPSWTKDNDLMEWLKNFTKRH